uniref:Uncharacterized protein n=1 Tax=viral metagenome TaxID=1070528 RepID=A0A6C0I6S4_9ZZZZ
MSSINTGYQSQMISTGYGNSDKLNKTTLPVYKYLDIDSTYRSRIDYPDPNSFVVRNSNSSNVSSNNLVAYNLPVYSFPMSQLYVAGLFSPLKFQSGGTDNLTLDTRETSTVPNFYAGYFIESIDSLITTPTPTSYSTVQYTTIASYNNTSKQAAFTSPLGTNAVINSNYIIRKNKPLFIGNVSAIVGNLVTLTKPAGAGYGFIPNDFNSVYYLRVRKSATSSLDNRIVQITLSSANPNQLTLNSNLSLSVNDSIEIIGPGQNIITSLRYASGGSQSIQGGDYELELLWLSVPNQILDVGYGGSLDRYPYIYCSLYTGITNTTQQVLYSNNPYTSKVIFKVPVNEYFGDTSFITLKDSKAKQTIYFDPSQDLFFELTLPDGTVISFNEFDNMPPYPPNPFLQINILVSMRKL